MPFSSLKISKSSKQRLRPAVLSKTFPEDDLASRLSRGSSVILSPSVSRTPSRIENTDLNEESLLMPTSFSATASKLFRTAHSPHVATSSILRLILEYSQGNELFFIRAKPNLYVLDGAITNEKEWSVLQGVRLSQAKLFSHNIYLESKCNEKEVYLPTSREVMEAGGDYYIHNSPESVLCIPVFLLQNFAGAVYITNQKENAFSHVDSSLISLVMSNLIGIINHTALEDCVKKTRRSASLCTAVCQRNENILQDSLYIHHPDSDVWEQQFVAITEDELLFHGSPFDFHPTRAIMLQTITNINHSTRKRAVAENNVPRLPKKLRGRSSGFVIGVKECDHTTYLAFGSLKGSRIWLKMLQSKVTIPLNRVSSLDIPLNIRISPEDIETEEIIGRGGAAAVFRGKWHETPVAVKKFYDTIDQSDVKTFFNEIEMLHSLKHPNIILLIGGYVEEGCPFIVCELAARGSLENVLFDPFVNLSMHMKLSFIKQIAKALQYLHTMDPPIIHRDLKPGNILVTESWGLKLGDFGLARACNSTLTLGQGTARYMAPEVLTNEEYTIKADIYSFGLVLWEVIEQQRVFQDLKFNSQVEIQVVNHKARPSFPSSFPQSLRYIASCCWAQEARLRPSATELVNLLETVTL